MRTEVELLGHCQNFGNLGILRGTVGAQLGHSLGSVGTKDWKTLGHSWGTVRAQLGHGRGMKVLGAQLGHKVTLGSGEAKPVGAQLGHS